MDKRGPSNAEHRAESEERESIGEVSVRSHDEALRAARDVVPRVLDSFFRSGELISSSIGESDTPDAGGIHLDVATSAGDVQRFFLWQPDVEVLMTAEAIQAYLVDQLENWFPTSSLGWGTQRDYA